MVKLGVPGQNQDPTSYADSRLSTVPVITAPRRPTTTDKKYPMWCEWRVNKDATAPAAEGEFWKLVKFESNGDATWVQIDTGSGGPGVDFLRDQVNAQIDPDASGNIDIDGAAVANAANPSGIPVETVAGTNKLDIQVQVAADRTGAPGDKNDAGLCSFDDTAFSVDADGYVALAGGSGQAVGSLDGDTGTATPTNRAISIVGGEGIDTSASGSTLTISGEDASDTNKGIASFDENDFVVTSGDVALANRLRLRAGYVENIGLDYDGGTGVFTIRGAQADLSATNPGYITLQSKADPGQLTLYEITANQDFIDDVGASEIIGNLFGLTTGIAHPALMPFYIYAVGNDNEDAIAFMISRVPHAKISPAAASIGDPGDPVADTQGSFWSLETITETEYDANPCLCIGSFQMVMSASDDWTVQSLNTNTGIGKFQEGVVFAISTGQYGASASTYIKPNGGTAPVFSGGAVYYTISKDGRVVVDYVLSGDGGTDGAGAVTTLAVLPYPMVTQYDTAYQGSGFVQTSSSTLDVNCEIQSTVDMSFDYNATLTTRGTIVNSDFGNGSREIRVQVVYDALPSA